MGKVVQKFKVGDVVTNGRAVGEIVGVNKIGYSAKFRKPCVHFADIHFSEQDEWSLDGSLRKSKIWHKIDEEPKEGKWLLLRHSDEWYHVGCLEVGKFDKTWVSDGTAAFQFNIFSEWAYIEDLVKL